MSVLHYFTNEERAFFERTAQTILRAKKAAVVTHQRPDGDAYGSAFALAEAIRRRGIECVVCNESDVPANLSFLEGTKSVQKLLPANADVYLAVDCADVARLGALSEPFKQAMRVAPTLNIDHHVSNTRFAHENFVRVCAANCINVFGLIECLGVKIDATIADYLMTGLLTDSGIFSHDDVNEEVFSVAAYLSAAGAHVCALQYELFKKQSRARALLFGEVTGNMKFDFDDRFAYIVTTKEAMLRHGADTSDTEGFVDFPLRVATVEIAASILEVKKGQYKISLRSKSYADVNQLASKFGGGGHVRAAGCMINGGLYDVLDKLSFAVSQYLE